MTEIWKPIAGYEGTYEVSNCGRVRSVDKYDTVGRFRKGRVLKASDNKYGYLTVCLYKDGKGKSIRVHRLVCEAFIPNENGLPCVNHKDENRQNNNADNLEWCTYQYNTNYGTRKAVACKPVIATIIATGEEEWYPSISDAIRKLSKGRTGSIDDTLAGKKDKAFGRRWRYAESEV